MFGKKKQQRDLEAELDTVKKRLADLDYHVGQARLGLDRVTHLEGQVKMSIPPWSSWKINRVEDFDGDGFSWSIKGHETTDRDGGTYTSLLAWGHAATYDKARKALLLAMLGLEYDVPSTPPNTHEGTSK